MDEKIYLQLTQISSINVDVRDAVDVSGGDDEDDYSTSITAVTKMMMKHCEATTTMKLR